MGVEKPAFTKVGGKGNSTDRRKPFFGFPRRPGGRTVGRANSGLCCVFSRCLLSSAFPPKHFAVAAWRSCAARIQHLLGHC